ncbi:activator-dependent family glycosyltransferase [Amycolatopsis sp. NPDC059090]|uniref:activator-dependent family glycosyltransferase n=1 Tax=unclassified Amycolatopsis TaxID=2618356 RepID=UPI00366FBBE2
MRVLFVVLAVKAHLYNMVPLAWGLRAAGHEVHIASHPDLVPDIVGAGLPAVAVGEPLNLAQAIDQAGSAKFKSGQFQSLSRGMAAEYPEKVTWEHALGEFTVARAQYEYFGNFAMTDDLVRYARYWRPDLVVWDGLSFAGPVAAKACGAAHARMSFALDYITRMRHDFLRLLPEQPSEWQEDPMAEWMSAKLSRYDCEFSEDVFTGQWTIDVFPEWMRFPLEVDYLRMRPVAYNGSVAIPDWLRRAPERPRICFTLGLSGREVIGDSGVATADILTALASREVELVATLSVDQLGPLPGLPGNVRIVDYVPLNDVLPSCAALIHHGGSGTTNNALLHGVPQLIIPSRTWQEADLATLIENQGAGLAAPPEELTADGLAACMDRLLAEPSFGRCAGDLRKDVLSAPSPAEIVPELEKRVSRVR